MDRKKPTSFKEYIGQSLIARDAKLQELHKILKTNNCKFCHRGITDDNYVNVCVTCGYKICDMCKYSMRMLYLDDIAYCKNCANIKCASEQSERCQFRNIWHSYCKECKAIYCSEHPHPHTQIWVDADL